MLTHTTERNSSTRPLKVQMNDGAICAHPRKTTRPHVRVDFTDRGWERESSRWYNNFFLRTATKKRPAFRVRAL